MSKKIDEPVPSQERVTTTVPASHVLTQREKGPLYERYERYEPMLEAGTKPNLAELTVARTITASVSCIGEARGGNPAGADRAIDYDKPRRVGDGSAWEIYGSTAEDLPDRNSSW